MKEIILSYLVTLILQISVFISFKKLSNKQLKINKISIVCILLICILQIFLNLNGLSLTGNMITLIYFYYMFQRLYNCTSKESKNYGIILWITCLFLDLIVMLVFNVFDLFKYYEINPAISKIIGTLCMSVILIIISFSKVCMNHLRRRYNKLSKLNIPGEYILIVIIVLLVISLMELKFIKNDTVISLLFIIAVLFTVLIIQIIAKNYRIMVLKLTNKLLEENNLTNKKVITEYSIFKHNFESELLGIKDVANKEAKALIDDLLEDTNSSVYIKNDINAMPLGINGLVMGKLAKHEKSNVNISITNDITSNILDVVSPRSYNLFCESLGISLDNALESAKNTKEKLVYLEFKETDTEIKLTVINTFSGGVDLDSLGEVNYTSKKKGHGLGLYSLFRKNLNIKTSIKNNLFINDIAIKKSQAKSE